MNKPGQHNGPHRVAGRGNPPLRRHCSRLAHETAARPCLTAPSRLSRLILLLLATAGTALAQDELNQRFPAKNAADRDAALAVLIALPANQLTALAGQTTDLKAQYAVGGLSDYVTRPRADAERRKWAAALTRAAATAPTEVKAFLIEQLRIVRHESTVPFLQSQLADPALADPAARALTAIGGARAQRALLAALPASPAAMRPVLLNALATGFAGIPAKAVTRYATDTDRATRLAALRVLAGSSDPRARHAFAAALQSDDPFERGAAATAYLDFARALAARRRHADAAAMCREVVQLGDQRGEAATTLAGLAALLDVAGDAALPDLLAAMRSDHRPLRAGAIALTRYRTDAAITDTLLDLCRTGSPAAQADALDALAAHGDRAREVALELLGGDNAEVRERAAWVLARLDGARALPVLVARLPASDAATLRDTLASVPGQGVREAAVAALPTAATAAQAVLLELLGNWGATAAWDTVAGFAAADDDRVRRAAIKALGDISTGQHLPRLVALFVAAPDGHAVRLADAVGELAAAMPDATAVLAVDAQLTGAKREAWYGVLARMGGPQALAVLERDAANQRAAVRVLSNWKTADALPVLMRLAQTAADTTDQVLAIRGGVRLAQENAAALRELLAAAQRPEDKQLVQAALDRLERKK